jgi:hypothetical protein
MGSYPNRLVAVNDVRRVGDLGNWRASITFMFERGGDPPPADLRPLPES